MGGKRRNALKKKSRGNETECTPTDSRASVKLMICGNILAKEPSEAAITWSGWNKSNIYWKRWPSWPSAVNVENIETRTIESVISPVCALRVIKTRAHSLLAQLRQRGASEQSPCVGLFGCPIPLYLFDYFQHKALFNQTGNKCFLMWPWVPKLQQDIEKSLWDWKRDITEGHTSALIEGYKLDHRWGQGEGW